MRASKVLKSAETLAAEAQEEARIAKEAAVNTAVATVVRDYKTVAFVATEAKKTADTAARAVYHKLETAYIELAALSHANNLNDDQITLALNAAVDAAYGNERNAKGQLPLVATKLRAQLKRAMDPKVRENIAALFAPWHAAWEAEAAADKADQHLRNKFHSRGVASTQALELALGEPAHGKVPAVPGVIHSTADQVVSWVKAHPRKAREAAVQPTTAAANAATAVAADADTPRKVATAKVENLIAAVEAVAKDYPDTGLFEPVLAALRLCTGDKLVPATQAPSGAEAAAKAEAARTAATAARAAEVAAAKAAADAKAAEPVAGASDLESAITADERRELDLLRQLHALRAGK